MSNKSKDLLYRRVHESCLKFGDEDGLEFEDKPFTGICYSFYPNGVLREEESYEVGFPKGACRRWYPSGFLKEQFEKEHGKRPQEVKTWHENGQLRSIRICKGHNVVSYVEWDEDGHIKQAKKGDSIIFEE